MCELLTKWGASEWAGIIQAGGAIISSIFLFYTFNSQKESAEILKKTSEIDKKAKRAEYMPIIESVIKVKYPSVDMGFEVYHQPFNGGNTIISAYIFFNKNAVQLLSFKNLDKLNNVKLTSDPIDKNNILLPGDSFKVTFTLNFQEYFDLINEYNVPDYDGLIQENGVDYRGQINFTNELFFVDMLDNKYKLEFKIIKTEKLVISDLRIID